MIPPRIFVLGSFVAACTVKVDRIPRAGETLRAHSFKLEAGGKGFNCAAAIRRLGAEVDGLLAVGDDHFATLADTALAAEGLSSQLLLRIAGQTGAGVGFINSAGENWIAVHPGANALLSANHVEAATSRLLTTQAIIAQFEIGDEAIAAGFALARRNGTTTFLNPSPFRPIHPRVAALTDILVVNETEAAHLTGHEPTGCRDGLASLLAWGDRLAPVFRAGTSAVVVTGGAAGAVAFRPELPPLAQPAFAVRTIDTIGAGDAFMGGLALSLVSGLNWAESLRCAAACGAHAVTGFGVLASLPDAKARDALLTRGEMMVSQR